MPRNVSDDTFGTVARYPVGYGVLGTVLTGDGRTLYANNEAASTVTAADKTDDSPKRSSRASPSRARASAWS